METEAPSLPTVTLRTAIAAACAKETSRYAINGFIPVPAPAKDAPDAGYVVATDGRCLACAAASVSPETPPPDKDGRKGWPIIPSEAGKRPGTVLSVNGQIQARAPGRSGKVTVHDRVEATYPPVADVIPEAKPETVWIGLNAELLSGLADALRHAGDERLGIVIGINAPNKPILVMPISSDGSLGVLMPIHTGGSHRDGADKEPARLTADWMDRRAKFTAAWKAAGHT